MFNLFKRKGPQVKIIDRIWVSEEAKWKAIADLYASKPDTVVLSWFDRSKEQFEKLFPDGSQNAFLAREIHRAHISGREVIFTEHHPLGSKEQELFHQLQLTEAVVYSALDEPLFKYFGSDRIVDMMKRLGMKEDEMVQHAMISSAISNAQDKIEKKVTNEHTAVSQADWMQRNLPAK